MNKPDPSPLPRKPVIPEAEAKANKEMAMKAVNRAVSRLMAPTKHRKGFPYDNARDFVVGTLLDFVLRTTNPTELANILDQLLDEKNEHNHRPRV